MLFSITALQQRLSVIDEPGDQFSPGGSDLLPASRR